MLQSTKADWGNDYNIYGRIHDYCEVSCDLKSSD
jgi:hypothetical protein